MSKYIDADRLRAEIDKRMTGNCELAEKCVLTRTYECFSNRASEDNDILAIIDSLQQEQPKGYFFCKFGGMLPKCADCARNHANSPYNTKDIDTWMQPGILGTKQCSDYICKDESELDKEIDNEWKKCNPIDEGMGVETANIHIEAFDIIARHFYELGQRKAAEMYDEVEYNRQRATGGMMEYDAGFKAGSQWLAEQGVSVEANIRDCSGSGYLSLVMPNNINNRYKSFNDGDKVIVQIRKKEESR